jgi:hypothetical protein
MNKEQQQIAIAEACGWKWEYEYIDFSTGKTVNAWISPTGETSVIDLPNYLSDLNAMHEAEKILDSKYEPARNESQRGSYLEWLGYCGENNTSEVYGCAHATAAQRAEAFLRTIGKWEES